MKHRKTPDQWKNLPLASLAVIALLCWAAIRIISLVFVFLAPYLGVLAKLLFFAAAILIFLMFYSDR